MWDEKYGDNASTDSDNDDSGRVYDFVVAKTNDQEENVVARPGFTVHFFIECFSPALTSPLLSSEVGLSASCLSTTSAKDLRRRQEPIFPISEAAIWRNHARRHDSRVQTGVGIG